MSIAIIRVHEREMELVEEYSEPYGFGLTKGNGVIKMISGTQFNSLVEQAYNKGFKVFDYRDF